MRWLLALLCCLALSAPASAQSIAGTCQTYDTVALSSLQSSVISSCQFNTGPYDSLVVSATGQVTCVSGSDAGLSLIVMTGAPKLGASFNGSIASNVLTVASMVTPGSFIIEAGEILSDANSGTGIPSGSTGSTVTVGTQIDGPTGGTGHYNLTNASGVTVGSEQMWALYNYNVKPPSSAQIREILEHLACQNGDSYIVNIQGPSDQLFSPNTNVWVILSLTSEKITSVNSSSWKNGQITAFAPATPPTTGGTVQ